MKNLRIPLFLLAASLLEALPSGLEVGSGKADLQISSKETMEILVSKESILNWQEFSIEENEKVSFLQPDAASCVMNRVLGDQPSRIFGQLQANGKVLLINQQGVLFGAEARLDVGGLIASTLELQDRVFLESQEWSFSGDSEAMVQNLGSLRTEAGDLVLIGRRIENHGFLEAQNGTVRIGAGTEVLISPNGVQGIYVKSNEVGAFFDQSGVIRASRVDFQVDGNPYELAFHHRGSTDALGVEERHGEIFLRVPAGDSAVQGTLSAEGGRVELIGQRVVLFENAVVDVSSPSGGGTVLVGGDYQGANPSIQNAEKIYIHPTASIRADATDAGDGGRIILWSDHGTQFLGSVSAKANSGDGGFIEVSGKDFLDFQGDANCSSLLGHAGLLLLDPVDVTISGAANANIAAGNLPTPPPAVANPYTVLFNGSPATATINNTALQNGLGTNDVIVNSGAAGTGLGDITVTGAVSWASGFSLTLTAARDINVRAAIQENNGVATAANRVILTAARNITIGGAGFTGSAGSQNGGTQVSAVGDLLIGGAGSGYCRIGFSANTLCQGSIAVSCSNLSLLSANSATQIGHGRLNVASPGLMTLGANITVNAAGNISMFNGSPVNSHSKIGHGSAQMGAGDSLDGNIQVISGGSLSMTGLNSNASGVTIGHGPGFGTGNLLIPFISGEIDVRAALDLTMIGAQGNARIGHGSRFTQTNVAALSGNISVCCGRNADLSGPVSICHVAGSGFAGQTIMGNLDVSIGGNLSMSNTSPLSAAPCFIGTNQSIAQTLTGTLNLSVCGNATITTPTAAVGNFMGIGYLSSVAASPASANIAIGGNLTAANLTCPFQMGSQLDLNLAVGGNLTASMTGAFDGYISSGILNTTRIYTGGSLIAASTGGAVLAIGAPLFLTAPCANIDVRAGGDIQWPNNYSAAPTGSINIQAGHSFAAGELWSGNATQLVAICGQTLVPAHNLLCGSCGQFTTASSATSSTCGAFAVQAGPSGPAKPINFSNGGSLTLTSLCTSCSSGAAISLLVGAAATNDVRFTNPIPGSVTIGPFANVDINQAVTTTTGAITILACDNLNINPGSNILANGAGAPITLIADIDDTGVGNLNLMANVTSTNGNILLDAGFGGLITGSSSIYQTIGAVSSGTGTITAQAGTDIVINGSPISITSTNGAISLEAGRDITVNHDIISTTGSISSLAGNDTLVDPCTVATAGPVEMITGHDMTLMTATITSSGSSVDLVVDSDFPAPPLIGPGAFFMDGLSQINGASYIRIYTAMQALNSFAPGALFNGAPFSSFPLLGTLFQDSLYEQWCTYFPDGSGGSNPIFRIFYKDCLQQVVSQAMIVVDEVLLNLHPYNEFPGWEEAFWVQYAQNVLGLPNEPFMLRRRNLNVLNHPKSYTILLPE